MLQGSAVKEVASTEVVAASGFVAEIPISRGTHRHDLKRSAEVPPQITEKFARGRLCVERDLQLSNHCTSAPPASRAGKVDEASQEPIATTPQPAISPPWPI